MPYKCASRKQFFIGAPKFKLVGRSIIGEATLCCETCCVEYDHAKLVGGKELGTTMRRRVTFEHPETVTTSTAIDVVPPRRQLVLSAMAKVSMWRAGELVAACTRDLLQSSFTFWRRQVTALVGFLVFREEGDNIAVDATMMWAVNRIDSVNHNMC